MSTKTASDEVQAAIPKEDYGPVVALRIEMPAGMLRRLTESASAQGKPVEELCFELLENHLFDLEDSAEIARLRADPGEAPVPFEQLAADLGL